MSLAFEPMSKGFPISTKESLGFNEDNSKIKTENGNISKKSQLLDNKLIINNFLTIKRKKYSMFPSEVKKKCIEAASKNDLKTVSKMFAVPLKSLKRWIKVGPERKKGGGRKIRDPEMEKKLFSWYTALKNNNCPVTPKMIKQKALSITKFSDFIASKGWLEKFKRKFKLELSRENKIETHKNIVPLTISSTQTNNSNKTEVVVNKIDVIKPIPITESKEIKKFKSENVFISCVTNPNTPEIK